MSKAPVECGSVRELLPDFVAGRLADAAESASVAAHVARCGDCEAEMELVRIVFRSRATVAAGLAERVRGAVSEDRRAPARTWWGIYAAAIAALALGIGITSRPSPEVPADVPGFAYEVDEGDVWVSDDGLVAGAPLFDDLSDDALMQLLDELAVGTTGGSA